MATDVPIFAQGILHPSGLIWAEKRDYFFPWGDNEIWSRSMIDSDNGVVEGVVWDVPESQPRVVPPFSLLEFRQNPVCQNTTMTRVAAEPPETEIILSSPCSQSEELDTKHSPIASVMSWTIVDAPNSPSDRISLSSAIYVRDGSSPLNPIHVSAKNQSIHGLSVEDSLEHVPQSMIYPSASASSLPASLHDTGLSPSPAAACEALSDKVPATTDLIISEKASDEPIPKATLDEALVLTDNLEVSKKASNEPIPKLEETIPDDLLPEILLVDDPNDIIHCGYKDPDVPKRYKRKWPAPASDRAIPTIGKLAIHDFLGTGSHSRVARGNFTPAPPVFVRSGEARVAVKMSCDSSSDRTMLDVEAQTYNTIPKHLMEDWTGFHYLEEGEYDSDGIVPASAVVPKFYGYYEPEDPIYQSKRILLLEECGNDLDHHQKRLEAEDRHIIFSYAVRLHRAGVTQGSFYERNVLIQPGPLSQPPSLRSLDTPSFRIIDFGRAAMYDQDDWDSNREFDIERVKRVVYGRSATGRPMSAKCIAGKELKETTREFSFRPEWTAQDKHITWFDSFDRAKKLGSMYWI